MALRLPVGEIECPACGGKGCDRCGGKGACDIAPCPWAAVTSDVVDLLMLEELFEKGLPPVAGGVLDQAKGFIEAARLVRRLRNQYEAKRWDAKIR